MSERFDSYKAVEFFNKACGNNPPKKGSPEWYTVLKNQVSYLLEEVKEIDEAIDNEDPLEILDGMADVQFVLDGLIYLAQLKHREAVKKVCANNDLKFTTSLVDAMEWSEDIGKNKGEEVYINRTELDGVTYYCVKRCSDNKILKPTNFPKVDLKPLVVEFNQELMVVTSPKCSMCESLEKTLDKVLGIHEYTRITPMESDADKEFCLDNGFGMGDIILVENGEFQFINFRSIGRKASQLEQWLKLVNYHGI